MQLALHLPQGGRRPRDAVRRQVLLLLLLLLLPVLAPVLLLAVLLKADRSSGCCAWRLQRRRPVLQLPALWRNAPVTTVAAAAAAAMQQHPLQRRGCVAERHHGRPALLLLLGLLRQQCAWVCGRAEAGTQIRVAHRRHPSVRRPGLALRLVCSHRSACCAAVARCAVRRLRVGAVPGT